MLDAPDEGADKRQGKDDAQEEREQKLGPHLVRGRLPGWVEAGVAKAVTFALEDSTAEDDAL